MLDLVIRNALVFDGSGMPPFRGAVGVRNGRIVGVGRVHEAAAREIDAQGLALAPGFIDVHTHYDAQLSWDGLAQPALEHGVTTIVTGNCSLSLAPIRPGQRDRLCRMFRQIEDLPQAAFDEGVHWAWETFGEWIAALRGAGLGINLAPLVGHNLIRMWVMGEDAHHREATAGEVEAMQQVLRDCLAAGASGLSTSYIDVDELYKPVPSRMAAPTELEALVRVLGESPHGILQVVHEYNDREKTLERLALMERFSLDYGVQVTLAPLFQNDTQPGMVDAVLDRVAEAASRGARVWPQAPARPMEANFKISAWNFILLLPTWMKIPTMASRAEQVAFVSDPQTRAQLVAEALAAPDRWYQGGMVERLDRIVVREVADPRNKALVGRTLADLARERGVSTPEVLIDIALSEGLETTFKSPAYGHADTEIIARALRHPNVLLGASDAGAHVQAFASNGDTGYLFQKFVRETGTFDVAGAVRKMTMEPALAMGISDRGLLNPGYAADLVLFDPQTIDWDQEIRVDDLPGAGYRYIRRAQGIDTVIVNGVETWSASGGYAAARAGEMVFGEHGRA